MSLDFSMSIPFEESMSMLCDDAFSLSFDFSLSMPFDATISLPFDDDSLPLPLDNDPSLEKTLVCDDSLPSITVPIDFEVEIPKVNDVKSFLTAILSTAIEADFALCSDSLQKLPDKERKLEESNVHGIKILNVTEVNGTTCNSEDSDCHIVHVENKVFYAKGTSSDAARAEFLEKLSLRLAKVDGVRVQEEPASSSSGLPTKVNDSTEKDSTSKGLSAAQTAMIVVISVAAAFVVLATLVVLRKLAMENRGGDKSVASEESILMNTKFYPAFTDLA